MAIRMDYYPYVTMPMIGKSSSMIGAMSFFNSSTEPLFGF
jgi:hypothetical protein